MRNLAVLTTLLFVLAQRADAVCMRNEPPRVATVTVRSCNPVAEVAKVRLGTVDLPWVVRHVNRTLEQERGVVIDGKVTRKVHLEQYGDRDFRLLDVVPSDEAAVWFVRGENLSCEAFKPESVVEIYVSDKCCDVTPPMDVPCLLGVEQARPVSEHLRLFLTSAGF